MQIHGFQKTTLLDYPEHLAATIFLGHCNFRCPFCHNSELVLSPDKMPTMDFEEILSFLRKRTKILDGICITGGEPTLSPDLETIICKIRDLGFKIKLDTNGSNPEVIKSLIEKDLLDYIALDIKSTPEKYAQTCGLASINLNNINESVSFLMTQDIPYEFRTTIVKELHTLDDILEIGRWIQGCKAYYLQSYRDSEQVIKPGFTSYTKEELTTLKTQLNNYINYVEVRGIEG